MIKVEYDGMETTMEWEELRELLQESTLPWKIEGDLYHQEIFVKGYELDLNIKGEMIWTTTIN